ncbi:RNA recognition motif 2, partial [Aulographum hederae CBS 113979]
IDIRLTLMLRNIPKSANVTELIHGLNHFIPGKFDFVYLRIDFKSGKNLGYAFVNLTNTDALLALMDQEFGLVGRPWSTFMTADGHERRNDAQMSYATTQGLDCLIEKFRNSSVMDEVWMYK